MKTVPMKKKRRARGISIDAEIRQAAKQIHATQMAEAMKAAALGIVARKLDEIRMILHAAGLANVAAPSSVALAPAAPAPAALPVEHPCCLCGRAGVRRSKPNRFNPTGSWYCQAHMKLALQNDADAAMDERLHEQPATTMKRPAVAPAPPAQLHAEPASQEPAGAASIDEAMASLGVA